MRAMVLDWPNTPLVMRDLPVPEPSAAQILIANEACGACRTELHVVDGERPDASGSGPVVRAD
jgi:propanol-preferring alcohol dehydrogenase